MTVDDQLTVSEIARDRSRRLSIAKTNQCALGVSFDIFDFQKMLASDQEFRNVTQ